MNRDRWKTRGVLWDTLHSHNISIKISYFLSILEQQIFFARYVCTYTERSVIKSPIRSSFEEVRVSIRILQGGIDVVRDAFPVRERFGVRGLDRRPLSRVEPPELRAFVEVDLAVA